MDTGLYPSNKTRFVCKCSFNTSATFYSIINVRNNKIIPGYGFHINACYEYHITTLISYYMNNITGNYTMDMEGMFSTAINSDIPHEWDFSAEGLYYDGNKIININNIDEFQLEYTMRLCSVVDSIGVINNGDVYYIKIYEDNILVRNYIPVQNTDTNVIGYYDLVEGKFCPSATDTPFTHISL